MALVWLSGCVTFFFDPATTAPGLSTWVGGVNADAASTTVLDSTTGEQHPDFPRTNKQDPKHPIAHAADTSRRYLKKRRKEKRKKKRHSIPQISRAGRWPQSEPVSPISISKSRSLPWRVATGMALQSNRHTCPRDFSKLGAGARAGAGIWELEAGGWGSCRAAVRRIAVLLIGAGNRRRTCGRPAVYRYLCAVSVYLSSVSVCSCLYVHVRMYM